MRDPDARQLSLPFSGKAGLTATARVLLRGKVVRYAIKRSRGRRSISLRIDEEGLRVSAPLGATLRAIEKVLCAHAQWIVEKLDEWEARRMPAPRWCDGDTLMLHGEPLTLRLVTGVSAARLEVGAVLAPNTEERAALVTSFLKEKALAYFVARTAHFCERLTLDVPHVRLSNARTRWGSCHSGGRIHLNWRLIQMPQRLADYVVAHEVAHLKEMNHSARFWRVVGALVPDYAARRKEIRSDGHRYLVV